MALVTLNGIAIADPSKLELGIFRLTKASRSANGTMNMEIIAIKRQVSLQWEKIKASELKTILDLLDAATFHTLVYPDPQGTGGTKTITAYVGDITESAWYMVGAERYWENVRVGLIER